MKRPQRKVERKGPKHEKQRPAQNHAAEKPRKPHQKQQQSEMTRSAETRAPKKMPDRKREPSAKLLRPEAGKHTNRKASDERRKQQQKANTRRRRKQRSMKASQRSRQGSNKNETGKLTEKQQQENRTEAEEPNQSNSRQAPKARSDTQALRPGCMVCVISRRRVLCGVPFRARCRQRCGRPGPFPRLHLRHRCCPLNVLTRLATAARWFFDEKQKGKLQRRSNPKGTKPYF